MTAAHRRYVAGEMAIAAVINAVLSLAFVFLVFGGRAVAPVSGWSGVAIDALPQSFMVALMSCLVPTLLTRRRVAAGTVATRASASRLPRGLIARSLLIAGTVAIVATLLQLVLLPALGTSWSFAGILLFKCLYGAALGAVIAAVAIRAALGDRPR